MPSTVLSHEWLRLVEVSGPFVSVQALGRFFPQGLDAVSPALRGELSRGYDEWTEAVERGGKGLEEAHRAWCQLVLERALGIREADLAPGEDWSVASETGVGSFSPDRVLRSREGRPLLFISLLPPLAGPSRATPQALWPAPPVEKARRLCQSHGVPFALVSDGEEWTLVSVPQGELSGTATWLASLFFQEPDTLRAFVSLLSARSLGRILENLLRDSREDVRAVTDALGGQVRSAVEVFVRGLSRIDSDSNGTLLAGIPGSVLYEASLTLLMRLVFLLCAEERGLLLAGVGDYDSCYAVSTLRAQLAADGDRYGPQILETRFSAYARLLALFRAVYGGIEHTALRLPALGGSLFDPDRFPFLEGRAQGTSWRAASAPVEPPPVDDRTILHVLDALQILRQGDTAVPLSFRSLDVEQIGYIYEGLLEFTAERASGVVLGLEGTARHPLASRPLERLEELAEQGGNALFEEIKDITGRQAASLRRFYRHPLRPEDHRALLEACRGDGALAARIEPFFAWMRSDAWGKPFVCHPGAFHLVPCDERAATGTQYTPRALTEPLVREALEPMVYEGPAEGLPRAQWRLRTPSAILSLKICDLAMGSAAFLVQDCRYLADRLVEAWAAEEKAGRYIDADGVVCDAPPADPMPPGVEERTVEARRLVAERCLYGVDINPLAVELAKLSLWLVTLAKNRPFGFLDHNLRSGDSLLGITNVVSLWQHSLHPEPGHPANLLTIPVISAVTDAAALRGVVRTERVLDIRDVQHQDAVATKARASVEHISRIADALVGRALACGKTGDKLLRELSYVTDNSALYLNSSPTDFQRQARQDLFDRTHRELDAGLPPGRSSRHPFHWVLEFPEVFADGGFDAITGNPPFLGGKKITTAFGTPYRNYLVAHLAETRTGAADLVSYFFLRAFSLLKPGGIFSLIATNTIAEGDTRQVALEPMVSQSAQIIAAHPQQVWPGTAGVYISPIVIRKPAITSAEHDDGLWHGAFRLGSFENPEFVSAISPFLSDREEWTPQILEENAELAFIGSYVLGMGFTMSEEEAHSFIEQNPKNAEVLFPYLNGEDLNSTPDQKASRWVINFFDWPLDRSTEGSWANASDRERAVFLKEGHVPSDYPGRVVTDFPELYAWVDEKVRPDRQARRPNGEYALRKPLPQRWWQYGDKRPALYHAIGRGSSFAKHPAAWAGDVQQEKVLSCSLVSKYLLFSRIKPFFVFTHATAVIKTVDLFPVLQSSFHDAWVRKNSSSLETRLRYTPSDSFETFPFPKPLPEELGPLGEAFDALRKEIMQREWIGLTALYNAFHDPEALVAGIGEMRSMQQQIDEAVARAYGWGDLDLGHGFHSVPYLPENDRVRYTISEPARLEILLRLSRLNRERAASQGD